MVLVILEFCCWQLLGAFGVGAFLLLKFHALGRKVDLIRVGVDDELDAC